MDFRCVLNQIKYLQFWQCFIHRSEAYSELKQTLKKEFFAKIVNGFQPLNYFHKKVHLGLSKKWLLPRSCKIVIKRFIDWPDCHNRQMFGSFNYKKTIFHICFEHNWTQVRSTIKKISGSALFPFGQKCISSGFHLVTIIYPYDTTVLLVNSWIKMETRFLID